MFDTVPDSDPATILVVDDPGRLRERLGRRLTEQLHQFDRNSAAQQLVAVLRRRGSGQ